MKRKQEVFKFPKGKTGNFHNLKVASSLKVASVSLGSSSQGGIK